MGGMEGGLAVDGVDGREGGHGAEVEVDEDDIVESESLRGQACLEGIETETHLIGGTLMRVGC